MSIFLFLVFGYAHALFSSPKCNVPEIDGHLHLTSVDKVNEYHTCAFAVEGPTVFIEIERYGGRIIDQDAWMNFTFEGTPDVDVCIGYNEIYVDGDQFVIPTTTKLEFSMWLQVSFMESTFSVKFAPPGSKFYGTLLKKDLSVSDFNVKTSASTTTGMEQVIQNVQKTAPELTYVVKRKSIIALEKRIKHIEYELNLAEEKNKRQASLHLTHFQLHREQISDIKSLDIGNDIEDVRTSIYGWSMVTVCIVIIGIVVSWRVYMRQKKKQRWTL